MTDVKCEKCGFIYDIKHKAIGQDRFDGKCPTCGSKKIRPHIVMFGEIAPNYQILNDELKDCELFIVIGTSGNVLDVSSMAKYIDNSILNNLEKSDAIDDSVFSKVFYKKATEAIDEIKEEIENTLEPIAKKYNYRCENCSSEYIFYEDLYEFECTICKDIVYK